MLFPDLEKLTRLVKRAAREELLVDFGHSDFEYKEDGSVVTPADLAMQSRLEVELKQHWPAYGILGEEMTESEQLAVIASEKAYWCIDPLDGTGNYAAGLPFFAVSIALIIDGQQQVGLIYDPVRDEMYTAIRGEGTCLNGKPIDALRTDITDDKPVIAEIDLKRLPAELAVKLVTERIFASQRNIGSSAIDWCWMAMGRFDIYLHGGQKMWDYAAGSLIFREAGGRCISLDEGEIFRGRLETRSVLACYDKKLFDYWYRWIGIPIE
ncbi:MAG TPA: inositol monophosphatase [Gammaproteobacteria bacterium]|nr:inositol monophosphatase [Gammaproteobacteria bacterium]